MAEVLLESLIDSLKILPLLFVTYVVIEAIEHRSALKFNRYLLRMGRLAPLGGALLGAVPQCGFSAAGATLYNGGLLSAGTLAAIFISTSDEAVPILLSMPEYAGMVFQLIAVKIVIAVIAGIILDFLLSPFSKKKTSLPNRDVILPTGIELAHRHEEKIDVKSILKSAFWHTLNIFAYIFVLSALLNAAVTYLGEHAIAGLLMKHTVFQPLLTSLIGFIPNCAASVLLTELFAAGSISLGSLIAGLCTGAGVGILILFKAKKNIKLNLLLMAYIYIISIAAGLLIDYFHLFTI